MAPHIVVFNHSASLLVLFRENLTASGYTVSTHLQELTSLDEIREPRPDLIILAYLRGYIENELDILDALKADPELGDIPVIVFATGPIRGEQEINGRPARYHQLVEKPFNRAQLLDAVSSALSSGRPVTVTG